MKNKKILSYLFVVLGAVLWGFIGVFNRIMGEAGCDMATRVVIRNFGTLAILTVAFALFHPQALRIKARHLPLFFGAGAVGMLGLSWSYFTCQTMCSLAVASVLLYLAPAFVVLGSAVLWKAPLTRRKLLSVAVAFLGCAMVSGVIGGLGTNTPLGLLLGVVAGMCYASYTLFAHYAMAHYDAYTMIYWTFVMASLGSIVFIDLTSVAAVLSQPKGIIGAVGLVVVATALPYIFYTKGLEQVEGGTASIIANVEPVVAALNGVFFYGEVPTVWTLCGILLVLLSAVLLAKGEKTHGQEGR